MDPYLSGRGKHLVLQQQLPDGVCEGPVHTSLAVECVAVTDGSAGQQVLHHLQVAAQTGVVEGGGVPLIPQVHIQLLVLSQIPDRNLSQLRQS